MFILYEALPEPSISALNYITKNGVNLCMMVYLIVSILYKSVKIIDFRIIFFSFIFFISCLKYLQLNEKLKLKLVHQNSCGL